MKSYSPSSFDSVSPSNLVLNKDFLIEGEVNRGWVGASFLHYKYMHALLSIRSCKGIIKAASTVMLLPISSLGHSRKSLLWVPKCFEAAPNT